MSNPNTKPTNTKPVDIKKVAGGGTDYKATEDKLATAKLQGTVIGGGLKPIETQKLGDISGAGPWAEGTTPPDSDTSDDSSKVISGSPKTVAGKVGSINAPKIG